ncbi:MAG: hypothetical protein LBS14_03955 [Holosporaceae bacterium]|jgi:hypothetical protein|nr:hypothetical protein [Holosporaceae bacterium]
MIKLHFFVSALSLLLISGCVDQRNQTISEKSSTATSTIEKKHNAIFKKLIRELIDAIEKDDLSNRSDKIWKIYEQELFDDVGFCGNKPLRVLLDINSSFLLALKERDFVKKHEYENASFGYQRMKTNLIQDLKKLSKLNVNIENDRSKVITLFEAIYTLHLRNFISENKNFLTDGFFDFVRRTSKDSDRIPAGFIAVLPDIYFEQPAAFPNTDLEAFVFSLKNSNCKIVAFVEGCCDAAIYKMYIFSPKNRKELQKIDIDVKSCYENGNCKYIHVGHSELTWDKENNVFTVGDYGGNAKEKYILDIGCRTVRSLKK